MTSLREHLPRELSQLVRSHLPEYQQAQIELPSSVIEHEVNPYLSVLDEAMIEAEYYRNGGRINTGKWLNKLKMLHPQVYNQLTTSSMELKSAIRKYDTRHLVRDDDVIIIFLMLLGEDSMDIERSIRSDEILLLCAILSKEDPNKLFDEFIENNQFKWYLTATYLLQQGATTTFFGIKGMVVNLYIDFGKLTESYKLFLKFVAAHPEVSESDDTILNMEYQLIYTKAPLYRAFLVYDPVFAAQLLDTPGLDLGAVFKDFKTTMTYLGDALRYIPDAADIDKLEIRHAYQEIIRAILKRNPEVILVEVPRVDTSPVAIAEALA